MYRVFSLNRSTGKEDQMRYDFDRREFGWEPGPGTPFPDLSMVHRIMQPIIDRWQTTQVHNVPSIRWSME